MAQIEKCRIEWLDTARGICAFCVLLAYSGFCPDVYLKIYTPFFLMLFFVISGFLFKERSVLQSFKKVLNGLVFPYFALCFIEIIIGFDNFHALSQGNYIIVLERIKDVFLGKNMWFIPCLIMVQIYFILLQFIIKRISFLEKKDSSFLIAGLLTLFSVYLIRNWNFETSYWYYDTALFALAYFTIGYYLKNKNITIKTRRLSTILLIVFSLVAVLGQQYLNVRFHVAYNYYASPFWFFFISWFGIISIVLFCQNFSLPRYIQLLGENTLLLFAVSSKTKALLLVFLAKMPIKIETILGDYIFSILFCFIEGIMIILLAMVVNRYIPQLVGKKNWIN